MTRMPSRPGTWAIVRATLAQAPADSRRIVFWLFVGSVFTLVAQAWDVSHRSGPPVVAEMLSVAAAVAGVMLLGITSALGAGGAAASMADGEQDRLTPVLQTLPVLAFLAGVLLSAAIALFVARGLLGLHPVRVIVPAALQVFALHVAWVTVRNTTRLLYEHAERRGAQAAKAQAELAGAQIRALQARMQPHFLFNALNTIASLVATDPAAAEATVEDLSAILRASLEQEDATTRSLRDELSLVRALVGVERRRLGDRLRIDWNVAADALDVPVPVLSIQPLVENAIRHGVASRIEGGAITVDVQRDADTIRVLVRDDGDGFARGWKEGTGLGNLRQRLQSLYGAAAAVVIGAGPGGVVSMTLPVRRP
jgi:two-component sensor histidine kinase